MIRYSPESESKMVVSYDDFPDKRSNERVDLTVPSLATIDAFTESGMIRSSTPVILMIVLVGAPKVER